MRGPLLAALFMVPDTALALSCQPYNAIAAFIEAADSDDQYVAVLGRLSFDESKVPEVDWSRQQDVRPNNFLTGRIKGKSLTPSGFDAPFARDMKINLQCRGPWCARIQNGAEHLVFLKRKNGHYLLQVDPCGEFAFGKPDRKTIRKIESCMQGKKCDPELPRR
ncbi:hypothetical protein SAMN05444851_2850 [Aliiroseovarius sediminilitoris]|uniref:Uncharacterized protein n=1 Tax=Aliiroseovarius sediminilitoris TaxID=1173584 RepID=A0A1I0QT64_9RHOB|nr:hypothetical protein [Aliiroseovarius sediminilitoris]SEW30132.1 hypothetical protein SAMN05444851_2850 [Aliiroseovarius sediminilitoris]